MSIPITLAHTTMRGLPQKIANCFQTYFDDAGVSRDVDSADLAKHAAVLAEKYDGETISVTVNGREATFKNAGELLPKLFNLSALGQYSVPRNEAGRTHLVNKLGGAREAFNSLIEFIQLLRDNFVPGKGENEVKNFDELRWGFNLPMVNESFAKNKEYFHRVRHYVFLSTDASFVSALPLFYWKAPRPQERKPLEIETVEEAASCMLAIGQKLSKISKDGNMSIALIGTQLMDASQLVAEGRATVSQFLDVPTLAILDKQFPEKPEGMGAGNKFAGAVAGLREYMQKEPALKAGMEPGILLGLRSNLDSGRL